MKEEPITLEWLESLGGIIGCGTGKIDRVFKNDSLPMLSVTVEGNVFACPNQSSYCGSVCLLVGGTRREVLLILEGLRMWKPPGSFVLNAQKIRRMRREFGCTVMPPASFLKITTSELVSIELGEKAITEAQAGKLAEFYGCKVEDFR